jgi:hypothetical protein
VWATRMLPTGKRLQKRASHRCDFDGSVPPLRDRACLQIAADPDDIKRFDSLTPQLAQPSAFPSMSRLPNPLHSRLRSE